MAPKAAKADKADKGAKAAPKSDAPKFTSVQILWIVMGTIAVLNILYIGAMVFLILKFKRETKEDPTTELRNKMVSAIHYAPITAMHISRLPAQVEKVPTHIKTVDQDFEKLAKSYKAIVDKKYSRTKSPKGWQLYGRSLYYIAKGAKTWHSAENFCLSKDSHLASILSDEEQNFITSRLNHSAWIGLTDEQEEGTWKWTDNSRVTTQYWSEGEPSNSKHHEGTEQDCVSIVPSATGKNWKDSDCYKLNGWVCKENLEYAE